MQVPLAPRRAFLARLLLGATLFAAVTTLVGCDYEDDYDHDPPAGQGALIVDNSGERNVDVFVDGDFLGETKDGDWRAFDLQPGARRVVLDESNGDASFSGDVDILENRRTILTITGTFASELSVYITYD